MRFEQRHNMKDKNKYFDRWLLLLCIVWHISNWFRVSKIFLDRPSTEIETTELRYFKSYLRLNRFKFSIITMSNRRKVDFGSCAFWIGRKHKCLRGYLDILLMLKLWVSLLYIQNHFYVLNSYKIIFAFRNTNE